MDAPGLLTANPPARACRARTTHRRWSLLLEIVGTRGLAARSWLVARVGQLVPDTLTEDARCKGAVVILPDMGQFVNEELPR